MPRFELSGTITVGVSYAVEADNADEAWEVDVRPVTNVGDANGAQLGLAGPVLQHSVAFHVADCFPDMTVDEEGGS